MSEKTKPKKKIINPFSRDSKRLLNAMEEIIAGNYNEIDTTVFHNPIYADKLNEVLRSLKQSNNVPVMRMNEAMEAVGDNELIKSTFDQVTSQTEAIQKMERSSREMEQSIHNIAASMGNIRDNTHEIHDTFHALTDAMHDNIQMVDEASAKIQLINRQMQAFKDKINKIGEIVDNVKKVALQSNILAMNASIEAGKAGKAGKGFGVVAGQMRELSVGVSQLAEKVADYVQELHNDTGMLADSMDETARNLNEGNAKVEHSLEDMQQMKCQLEGINTHVDSVFEDIDTQTNSTEAFSGQIGQLSESYYVLSKDCIALGRHVFQIGRYIDKTRSDMLKKNTAITELDWMRVFEVDHFILVWRVYNNIVGFERLQAKQVNNPTGCKLGKWIARQKDPCLTQSSAFEQLAVAHTALHTFATESWTAKEEGNDALALKHFQSAYQAFSDFDQAVIKVREKMIELGCDKATETPALNPR